MLSFRKKLVSFAAVITLMPMGATAQATTLKQVDENITNQNVAQANGATLEVNEISEEGYTLSVKNGTVEKEADGSIIIHDSNREVAATLQTAFLVSDGSVNQVSYDVSGNVVTARYSSPLVKGERVPVVTQDLGDCFFSSLNATGALIVLGGVVLTGGTGLVLGGAALVAGAASGGAGYTCGKAFRP